MADPEDRMPDATSDEDVILSDPEDVELGAEGTDEDYEYANDDTEAAEHLPPEETEDEEGVGHGQLADQVRLTPQGPGTAPVGNGPSLAVTVSVADGSGGEPGASVSLSSGHAGGGTGTDQQQLQTGASASDQAAGREPAAAPVRAAGLGSGLPERPKGLGAGLKGTLPPRTKAPSTSTPEAQPPSHMPSASEAPTETPAEAAEANKSTPAGDQKKVLGGLGGLPARPAKSGSPSTSGSALPSLPARPAGGLLPLQPKSKATPTSAAATSAATTPTTGAATSAPQQAPASEPPAQTGPSGGVPPLTRPVSRPAGGPVLPTRQQPPQGGLTALPGSGAPRAPGPSLPQRPGALVPAAAAGPGALTPSEGVDVVDPDEPRRLRRMRQQIQTYRVILMRVAVRLGFRYDSPEVKNYLAVMERLEKLNRPIAKRTGDVSKIAEREARALDASEEPDSRLGLTVKVLVLGMSGTGKSAFINSLLDTPRATTSAYKDATKRVRLIRGDIHGVRFTFIDTPGLHACSSYHTQNRALLKTIKRVYDWHKPNFVLYVDRLDAAKGGFGELSLLGQITQVMGQAMWRDTMVLLTHASSARADLGPGYDTFVKNRKNILQNVLRQAVGDMQLRNPIFLVDNHPDCPKNALGQPIVLDGGNTLAWKSTITIMLIGYTLCELVQKMVRDKAKAKTAGAARQQDLFKQLMRGRLPPLQFFVEQMAEGVLKPDSWAAMDDPFDQETDDQEAEEFKHMYYRTLYNLAKKGDPYAQKEYAAMLRKLEKLRKTYRDAFKNEDLEMVGAAGYEGYVAEGLDLGPTFDPDDRTNYRYAYFVPEMDWQIMPTLDYYGYEHEDAITGFVAEYDAQPFNRDGWGGVPMDLTVTVEKDKTTTCLQGEAHASLIHSVRPFGNRHITQITTGFELLRPNVKDVLYQLEVNTFKDGFLFRNDHAGVGFMAARMGEGGKIRKGPMGLGLRIQETFRAGPFKVEATAARVTSESGMGAKEEGWGARTFVNYDWLPGLGMNFDWYQEKNKETDDFQVKGFAANFTYDWDLFDAAWGMEVDYVAGDEVLHVDMNVFSTSDYRFAWILIIPFVNYVKDFIQRWRSGGGPEEDMLMMEGGEEEDAGMEGAGGFGGLGMTEEQMRAVIAQMRAAGLQPQIGGGGGGGGGAPMMLG